MKIVVCSGYFNPIHGGHLDYLSEAAKLGDQLIVIVNSDRQVKVKGSVPFMDEKQRLRIVEMLKPVTYAVIAIDEDGTVVKTLEMIYTDNLSRGRSSQQNIEMVFANGGDRKIGNTPEEAFCKRVGIETAYDIGGGKTESSSTLIERSKNVEN
jgi:D-beta-D-heptose 7-phosphate kinase/D-beta-D-heptose 1-phosphate adenosyltransferase